MPNDNVVSKRPKPGENVSQPQQDVTIPTFSTDPRKSSLEPDVTKRKNAR